MSPLSYRSVVVEVAAGVTLREISIPHRVIEIHVPSNVLNAFIRFGDQTKEPVPLTPGGRNRFCFVTPPSKLFISAAGGDALTIFGSEEVEPAFFPFASDSGSLRNEISCTWPEHTLLDAGAAVFPQMGWSTSPAAEGMWNAKLGTAPDDMQLYKGRLCYEARSAAATYAMRDISGIPIHMPLTSLNRSGQKGSDFSRVYWDTFFMQVEGVPNTDGRTGLAYVFRSVGSAGWWESLNYFAWGLGIVNEGGAIPIWHFMANRTGIAPTPDEDLSLGLVASTNWIRFDILHIAPTETRRARFLIYADGSLVIEREWTAGAGSLPDYSGVGGTIIRKTIAGESAAGLILRISGVSFRRGQLMTSGAFA